MNQASKVRYDVVTVTLNPAIDRTLTIPNFRAGSVHRVQQTHSRPGGKGVNVAAALAEYGMRVAATGLLGCENAALFDALFEEKRIADKFVRITGNTRVCIKIADPSLIQTTDINFPGLAPAPEDLDALFSALERLDARSFVIAGSVPEGVSPAIYRELVERLKVGGRRVAVDTSGEALRHAIDARPHLIKPNRDELEGLLGQPLPDEEAVLGAARKLLDKGIDCVVVSMGKAGACFVSADEVVMARPPVMQADNTVGAGDAMVAGAVAAELAGCSLQERARLATAFAIDALTRRAPRESSRSAVHGALSRVQLV